jgi:hypothetical protein
LLHGVTVACSQGNPDSRQTITESRQPEVTGSDLTRLEECEVDDETGRRISDLTRELEGLRIRYTENHPDVIATRRQLQELQGPALDACLEELQ